MSSLVFISGASSGLGLALARSVPFEARVIDLSRRGAPGLEHVRADLSTPEGWDAAAACFARELDGFAGERAVFIHASGALDPVALAGTGDPEAQRRGVLLNSAAGQILGDAFLRALRAADTRGAVVMISSGAAFLTYPGWTVYGAGKAALDHWVRIAACEQERAGAPGVRLLSIAPGILDTAMQAQARAVRDFEWAKEFAELKQRGLLRPPERAAAEIWAKLDDPDVTNGSVLDLHEPV